MTTDVEICILCLSDIENENFCLITENTIDILHAFSMNMSLDECSNKKICNTCSTKLITAFEFKSTCMFTNSTVITYKESQLDLGSTYLKESGDKDVVTLSEDEQICKLCMELTGKMFVPLQQLDSNMLLRFAPEIELNLIEDPVVCKFCFDSFITHSEFLKNCLDIQQRLINPGHCENDIHDDTALLESSIKAEEVDIKCESWHDCFDPEKVNIEHGDTGDENFKTVTMGRQLKREQSSHKSQTSSDIGSTSLLRSRLLMSQTKTDVKENVRNKEKLYSCDVCDYETKIINDLKKHGLMHKDPSQVQMFKRDIRDYETKHKGHIIHKLSHTDSSQVKMRFCEKCNFKSKYRQNLYSHLMTHKKPVHKCDVCEYKARFRGNLRTHQLMHKSPSELEMYKCDICDYESRLKDGLNSHMRTHKDPAQLQMFSCDKCNFSTKYRESLIRHWTSYRHSSLTSLYKCIVCNYETNRLEALKSHELMHEGGNRCGTSVSPSEQSLTVCEKPKVQWHRCSMCEYKTTRTFHLTNHELRHKDNSEMRMYKCDVCDFASRRKGNLKVHQLNHEDTSQRQDYKCAVCSYETMFRSRLKRHLLTHRESNDAQMYRCEKCDFKTIRKRSLTSHQLLHKDSSKIKIFRCDSCPYKTRWKCALRRHKKTH